MPFSNAAKPATAETVNRLQDDLLGGTINQANTPKNPDPQDGGATCEHCGKPFKPRSGTGGKPQRFCTPECRFASHANVAQRSSPHVGVNDGAAPNTPPEVKRTGEAPEADGVDFDWNDDDAVVVPEQRAGAVYWNPRGQIVIRQLGWPDDDPFVFFAPEHAVTIAKAILKLASDAAK